MQFSINQDLVIRGINFSEDEDKAQLAKQLEEAPLFKKHLSAEGIYRKRLDILKLFTDGYTVLETKVVTTNSYLKLLEKAISDAIRKKYDEDSDFDGFYKNREILVDGRAILDAIYYNSINPFFMLKHKIKSPKYSKYLIQIFGEQSYVVKLFNDRPSKEEIENNESNVIDDKKMVVSTLASNVMKMSANNKFSSCQDYRASAYGYSGDIGDLNLGSLPSSVHDETMGIAYIIHENEDVIYPCMEERMLLLPFTYNEESFLIACNYYHTNSFYYLESSLRSLYGNNIIFAHQNYHDESSQIVFEHNYDYTLNVKINGEANRPPYSNHSSLRYTDFKQSISINKTYLDITLQGEESFDPSEVLEEA